MAKLILVVEDNPTLRNLLLRLFRYAGYQPTGVEDAAEALELLRTQEFDLITLDLLMPHMDGNQFLIKLACSMPTLPVIVISASVEQLKPHPQIKAVLAKPFSLKQVVEVTEEILVNTQPISSVHLP